MTAPKYMSSYRSISVSTSCVVSLIISLYIVSSFPGSPMILIVCGLRSFLCNGSSPVFLFLPIWHSSSASVLLSRSRIVRCQLAHPAFSHGLRFRLSFYLLLISLLLLSFLVRLLTLVGVGFLAVPSIGSSGPLQWRLFLFDVSSGLLAPSFSSFCHFPVFSPGSPVPSFFRGVPSLFSHIFLVPHLVPVPVLPLVFSVLV